MKIGSEREPMTHSHIVLLRLPPGSPACEAIAAAVRL
jgi:hypothetical protein